MAKCHAEPLKCHSEPCPEINSGSSSESLRGRLASANKIHGLRDPEIGDPDPEINSG
jgi:hypothetical protein